MEPLFPVPAPRPRHAWIVAIVLLLSALALVATSVSPGAFPGDADLPFGPVALQLHHSIHAHGFVGYMADDLHGFPLRTDRLVTDGFPLDALSSWPFTAALGWERGMWAWIVAVHWALGLGGAWLGLRWWGSLGAGLVAGVGVQVGEATLREVAEGRPTQAFAALFLPFALGWGVEAARAGRVGAAVAAGLAAGLGALASIGLGPVFCAAALGPLLVALALGRLRGRGAGPPATPPAVRNPARASDARGGPAPPGSPDSDEPSPWGSARGRALGARDTTSGARGGGVAALAALAGLLVPLAPYVAWVAAGRGELPSLGMEPWAEAVFGTRQARPVDLAAERIFGLEGVAFGTLARPALVLAAVWGAWRAPLRRWAAPVALAGVAVLFGLGSWLPGPVVLPWGWLQELPGFSRLWWPDRAWFAVPLALALLAAGAPRRVAPLIAVALFTEAWVTSRALPLPALPLAPSPAARVLAEAPTVPFVLLPTGEGPFRPDRLDLLDQVHHDRPMANGTRPVLDLTSSDAVLRGWRNNVGLRALLGCEMGSGATPTDAARAAAGEALAGAGLREVYLDPRYADQDKAYAACVEGVLAGWARTEEPPLVRFRAP